MVKKRVVRTFRVTIEEITDEDVDGVETQEPPPVATREEPRKTWFPETVLWDPNEHGGER